MLRIPNLGRSSLKEIKTTLAQMGLHFGMSYFQFERLERAAIDPIGGDE